MARITVAWEALERGQFPPVCCRTGEPTTNFVRWRFTDGLMKRRYEGTLPISQRVVRRVRVYSRAALVAAAIGVAGVAYGVASTDRNITAAFGLMFVIAAIMLLRATFAAPRARRELQRGAVELRNMHPAFVQTIETAWARQRSSG